MNVKDLPHIDHLSRPPLQYITAQSTTSGDFLPVIQSSSALSQDNVQHGVLLSPSNSVPNQSPNHEHSTLPTTRGDIWIATINEATELLSQTETSSSSAVSQQAPPPVRYSGAEAPSHPDGPFQARFKIFPNGGDPRADASALYIVDKNGKGHYSAWCIMHQRRRSEDSLVQRLPDGHFVCKATHQCKPKEHEKWFDSRTPSISDQRFHYTW